jgi:3',5'-cyclic AMP phosphodiesterase CpdA
MRRLVHLSDLHFGALDERLLEPLRRRVQALEPHVVIVSGDLTQRARPRQFDAARRWLGTLPRPQVVVPGNHDVPLYNVGLRLLAPLRRYRRHFSAELEPAFIDEELAVMGVSTARSLVFKGGRINQAQIARVREAFCRLPARVTKIVVTHHPFDMPADWDQHDQVAGRAAKALRELAQCGADVYVSGHLHRSHSGELAAALDLPGMAPLFVAAGTATSTRGHGERNAFNLLRVAPDAIEIEQHEWDDARGDFRPTGRRSFRRAEGGWRLATAA